MIIFTLRRILLLIVTLFPLTFVGLSLSCFAPHAPLQDAPLWNTWVLWFNGLVYWDFGVSSINSQSTAERLKGVFPVMMELCILAFGFASIADIPVGTIVGATRHKWQDNLTNAIASLGFPTPVFRPASLLTLLCSLTLGRLPVSGRFDLLYGVKPITGSALTDVWLSDSPWRDEMIMSVICHMILFVVILLVAPITEVTRLMRISAIEAYDQSYVKAAVTHGLLRFTILRCCVLYNALPSAIPCPGLQLSTMLTLTMITEMVSSWPDLGRWLISAARQRDHVAISAGVMVYGSLVIIANVIPDILGTMANPLKHKEWYAL